MTSKEKKVSDCFKDLPIKERVNVIMTAKKVLEIQKENKVFLGNVTDPLAYVGGVKK